MNSMVSITGEPPITSPLNPVLDLISDCAFAINVDGTIISANEIGSRVFTDEDIVGYSLFSLFSEESKRHLKIQLENLTENKLVFLEELETADRDKYPFRVAATCLLTANNRIITFRKRPLANPELSETFWYDGNNNDLLEAIPAPVFCKNTDHIYTACNDEFLKFIGFPREELIGRSVFEVAPSKNAEIYKEADTKLFNRGGKQVYDTAVRYADGTMHDVVFHKSVFNNEQGEPAGLIGIILDVSKLVEAENKLKISSKKLEQQVQERTAELFEEIKTRKKTETAFRNILEASPVAVSITEIKDGRLSFVNEKLKALLGMNHEELIGKPAIQFWKDPSVRQEMVTEYNATDSATPRDIEIIRKNSEEFWVNLSWTKIEFDNEAKIVSWLFDITQIKEAEALLKTSHDQLERRVALRTQELEREISDRKKIEEVLRTSEAEFKASANSTSDWFWGTDSDFKFNSFSERMEEITGLSPDSIIGTRGWSTVETNFSIEAWTQYKNKLFNHEPFRDIKFDIIRNDGSILPVSISGIPIFDDQGEFKGYRGAGRDNSQEILAEDEARKLEQQLQQSQKMEAIGQLTGGVAHDFNNILAIILGNVDLANDDITEDSPLFSYMNAIERAASRGAQLTQRLLAYSRKQSLHPRNVNLNDLINDILELTDRLLGETIKIHYQYNEDINPVFADQNQIENALMNLCINSRDSMPQGGELYVETSNLNVTKKNLSQYPDLVVGAYSCLSVRDTGCGMDEHTLEHVFEPFFTTKEVGKGTGLGLSMIYGFAQQSKGSLILESKIGTGTKAMLILPSISEEQD